MSLIFDRISALCPHKLCPYSKKKECNYYIINIKIPRLQWHVMISWQLLYSPQAVRSLIHNKWPNLCFGGLIDDFSCGGEFLFVHFLHFLFQLNQSFAKIFIFASESFVLDFVHANLFDVGGEAIVQILQRENKCFNLHSILWQRTLFIRTLRLRWGKK